MEEIPRSEPSRQDLQRFTRLMYQHPWRQAVTMPEAPHQYTLRRQWGSREDFEWAVRFIRQHGYKAKFGGHTYVYFDLDGRQYWSMGWPAEETILINRAKKP